MLLILLKQSIKVSIANISMSQSIGLRIRLRLYDRRLETCQLVVARSFISLCVDNYRESTPWQRSFQLTTIIQKIAGRKKTYYESKVFGALISEWVTIALHSLASPII